jgi:predicted DNA-binding protein (UPF0251 family)
MVTKVKPADEPDLFSVGKQQSASPISKPNVSKTSKPTPSSLLLPQNLSNSLERLSDQEFRRLLSAVLNEQKRRAKSSIETTRNTKTQAAEVETLALTVGKLNAVRAAFKAGVKPTQIAKQFGLSQSQLRAALKLGSSRETIS